MKHLSSSSAAQPTAAALRKVLGWSLIVALGATVAASVAVKAMAQTAPKAAAPAAAAPTPPAPSPASNPKPVLASIMVHSCAGCHGTDGQLGDETFKPLAGMPVQQFVRTMTDFREGKRASTLMGHVTKGFTDADIQAMGEFFAAVPPLAGSLAAVQGAPQ